MAKRDVKDSSLPDSMPIIRRKGLEPMRNELTPREIKEIDISLLRPHPQNEKIYGNEDVSDLIGLIEECGRIIDSLVVNQDNIIISGHRRWMAAKELEYTTVPCEVIATHSIEEELELLIHYNAARDKTFEQRIRESMTLEEVYSELAKKRSLSNLIQNKTDMANVTISEDSVEGDSPLGATRDVVAKKAGISSSKTYNRGKNVILAVDRLRESGNVDDADLLLAVLSRSASAAEDLATKYDLSSLSDDIKRDLKLGKISVRAFIPKESSGNKKKQQTEYASSRKHIKVIISSAKSLKNIDLTGQTDKQNKKIHDDIESVIQDLQSVLNLQTFLAQ